MKDITFLAIIYKISDSMIIPGADLLTLVAIYVNTANVFADGN